jgi:hypothetical protein
LHFLGSDGDSYRSSESQSAKSSKISPSEDKPKRKSKSLLSGEYDEKEAQKSFQKALLNWRSSDKKSGKRVEIIRENNETSRDVITNTDLTEEGKKKLDAIRNLENYITSNHTLLYAERMLLQKYRRNQFELKMNNQNDEKSSTPELDKSLRETVNFGNIKMDLYFIYLFRK